MVWECADVAKRRARALMLLGAEAESVSCAQASNGVVEWQVPQTSSSSTLHDTHSSSDALSDRGQGEAAAPAPASAPPPPPGLHTDATHLHPGAGGALRGGSAGASSASGGPGSGLAGSPQAGTAREVGNGRGACAAPGAGSAPGAPAGHGAALARDAQGAAGPQGGPDAAGAGADGAADVNEVAALMRRRLSMGQLAGAGEAAGAEFTDVCGAFCTACACVACVCYR